MGITFGIITGFLIFFAIFLLIFVIIFGIILRYKKLVAVSPFFLIIMLISIIIGFSSVFAWFGKPHPVSCAFQPWLLGLPAISIIAALCVKTYRVWKIFRSEFILQRITDFAMLRLWILIMIIPLVIVILWSIISTPTAKIEDRDNEQHYVCTTGGFTGEPGGYIFFSIFVAYGAIVIIMGIILSVISRNVPSFFNESKLLAISIYNLAFLSAVIIPVFLVVQPFNPFVAWIVRSLAILYAFTATLILQFVPPIFSIIVIDRCKDIAITAKLMSHNSTSNTFGENKPSF